MTSNFRPVGPFPNWATDDNYSSGPAPIIGTPTKVVPTSGEKAQGAIPATRPPAQKFNWTLNQLGAWVGYFADVPLLNWNRAEFRDMTGLALNFTAIRPDDTNKLFYNELLQIWVMCGNPGNGVFYFADDNGLCVTKSTGSAFHFTHGCPTSDGRNLFFCSDVATSSGPQYTQSDVTGIAGFTDKHVAYPSGTSLYALDSLLLSNGDNVAVGGADGAFMAWRSTDQGATFTAQPTGFSGTVPSDALSRVIEGASGRLIAWANTTTSHGGDRVLYSDNHGATWFQGASFGFDLIVDIVYLPDEGLYLVAQDNHLYKTPDPAVGATAVVDIGTLTPNVYKCAAPAGSALLIVADANSPGFGQTLLYWDKVSEARTVHRHLFGAPGAIAVNSLGQFAITGANFFRTSSKASSVPRS